MNKPVKDHADLSVLTASPAFPNPTEVLSSERAWNVWAALHDKYDLIFIDSQPIMPVSDPLILSELSDGVIIVKLGGATKGVVARKACQSLGKMTATIIGVVMNSVRIPNGVYGSYYSTTPPYGEARKETV
jgi:Mrp family chromosome partitioning ATPase